MRSQQETPVTEGQIRRVFSDTLDKGASFCAICLSYREGEQVRDEIGVPYTIANGNLEVGPYFKNIVTSRPDDYDSRKKSIPITNILRFKRIELSDIV